MKKLIALLCAVTMILGFAVPAFASETNEGSLDFLLNAYTNAEQKSEIGVEVNKPLRFLSIFDEEVGLDVQYLVESILKSKINVVSKSNSAADMSWTEGYMQINPVVPIEISEDLKFSADLNAEIWVKIDLSEEGSCYEVVVKNPMDGKYLYLDLFDENAVEYIGDVKSMMSTMIDTINQDAVKMLREKIVALYEKYATVKKDGDCLVVSYTNDSFVDLLFDLVDEFYLSDSALENESVAQSLQEIGLTKESLSQVKFFVKNLGIFADNDAVVEKYKFDKNGAVIQEESKVRFDFNIFDILSVMGLDEEDVYPLTRDMADIDLTIVEKTEYISLNKNIDINMPVLTEENSTNYLDMLFTSSEEAEVEFVYQPEKFFNYANGMQNENGIYVNMPDFKMQLEWNGDADNLDCGVALSDANDVTLTFVSDNFDTVKVTGNVNSDTYYLNGMAIAGNKPFENVDGVLFAKIDVLNCVLGAEISSVTVNYYDWYEKLDTPEYGIELIRPNPGYTESEMTEELFDFDSTIGIIGGADGPTTIFVTKE